MPLFQEIAAIQAMYEQGLYSDEEYKLALAEALIKHGGL